MRTQALFISDLHLQDAMPQTTQAFLTFLQDEGGKTEAIYILGDLFEYWAGDDAINSDFLRPIIQALHTVSQNGTRLFWMCGNRDFLTGERFLVETGAEALPELAIVSLAGKKLMLAHGDAQCTDDLPYMKFRKMVRNPDWQKKFLCTPLFLRKIIITGMRHKSKEGKQKKAAGIMDVNSDVITRLFEKTGADIMIHGHTHRPGKHIHTTSLGDRPRFVLSDWDLDTPPLRGDWLELTRDGILLRHTLPTLL